MASLGLGPARVIAAVSFVMLLAAGWLLHTWLGAQARAEEAEALLDAEFARLDKAESERCHESSGTP
jgi:hypothetical protein